MGNPKMLGIFILVLRLLLILLMFFNLLEMILTKWGIFIMLLKHFKHCKKLMIKMTIKNL